jgi:hypothetical protein
MLPRKIWKINIEFIRRNNDGLRPIVIEKPANAAGTDCPHHRTTFIQSDSP